MISYTLPLSYPLEGNNAFTYTSSTALNGFTTITFPGGDGNETYSQTGETQYGATIGPNGGTITGISKYGATSITTNHTTGYTNTAGGTTTYSTTYSNTPTTDSSAQTSTSAYTGGNNTTSTTEGTTTYPTVTSYSSTTNIGTSTSSYSGFTSTTSTFTYSSTYLTTTTTNATSYTVTYDQAYTYYYEPAFATVYSCNSLLEIIWAVTSSTTGFITDVGKTYTLYTLNPVQTTFTVNVPNVTNFTVSVTGAVGVALPSCSYTYSIVATNTDGSPMTTTAYTHLVLGYDTNYLPPNLTLSTTSTVTAYVTTSTAATIDAVETSMGTALGSFFTSTAGVTFNTTYSINSFVNNGTSTQFSTVYSVSVGTTSQTIQLPYNVVGAGEGYTSTYINNNSPITGYVILGGGAGITVHGQNIVSTCFVLPVSNLMVSADSLFLNIDCASIYYPFYSSFINNCPVLVPMVYNGAFSTTNTAGETWNYSWNSDTLHYTSANSTTSTTGTLTIAGASSAAISDVAYYSSTVTSVFGGVQAPENQTYTIEIGPGLYKVSSTNGTSTGSNILNVPIYTTTTACSSQNFAISTEPYVTTTYDNGFGLTLAFLSLYSTTISNYQQF